MTTIIKVFSVSGIKIEFLYNGDDFRLGAIKLFMKCQKPETRFWTILYDTQILSNYIDLSIYILDDNTLTLSYIANLDLKNEILNEEMARTLSYSIFEWKENFETLYTSLTQSERVQLIHWFKSNIDALDLANRNNIHPFMKDYDDDFGNIPPPPQLDEYEQQYNADIAQHYAEQQDIMENEFIQKHPEHQYNNKFINAPSPSEIKDLKLADALVINSSHDILTSPKVRYALSLFCDIELSYKEDSKLKLYYTEIGLKN